jgi:hypothetical protein
MVYIVSKTPLEASTQVALSELLELSVFMRGQRQQSDRASETKRASLNCKRVKHSQSLTSMLALPEHDTEVEISEHDRLQA